MRVGMAHQICSYDHASQNNWQKTKKTLKRPFFLAERLAFSCGVAAAGADYRHD